MECLSVPSSITIYDDDTLDAISISSLEISDVFGDPDLSCCCDSVTLNGQQQQAQQLMNDDSALTRSTEILSRWGSSGSLCIENEEGGELRCPQRQPSMEWEHWGTSDTVDTQVVPYKMVKKQDSNRRRFQRRTFQNVSTADLSLHRMMARAQKLTKMYSSKSSRNESSSSSVGDKSGSDGDVKPAVKRNDLTKVSTLSPTLPKRQRTNRVTPAEVEENITSPPKLPMRQRTNGTRQ